MITMLLSIYLKLNMLLALSWILWVVTAKSAQWLHLDIREQGKLRLARALFLASLGLPMLLGMLALLAPALYVTLAAITAQPVAGEMLVLAGLDRGLQQSLPVAQWSLGTLLALLAVLSIVGSAVVFARRWLALKKLVDQASVWKSRHRIRILLSEQADTPFSTLVLGSRHIVMPYSLLASYENFRMAIKHELQHLRNGDLGWVILMEMIRLLCSWNPFAWMWRNEFDCLQEFACDEVLVNERRLGSQTYGHCLLAVAASMSRNRLPAISNMVPKFSLWRDAQSQLKRRVLMLYSNRNNRFSTLKSLVWALVLSAGVSGATLLVFTQHSQAQEARREYLPLITVSPRYPAQALQNGVEGWVQVEFTVDVRGNVQDVTVVDHCASSNLDDCLAPRARVADPGARTQDLEEIEEMGMEEYSGVFNEASLAAVSQFTFEPRLDGGQAVETPGVQYVFKFSLRD
ncbi:MAG: M56 family metallopeptidase [Pseudomonadales bacterium]|nr:M56 family metallopeptidase [Pseudomonadales bacterium]